MTIVAEPSSTNDIFTIGHSTHTFDDFVDLLRGAGVTAIVDVRRLPGSSRFPQFNEDALAAELPERAIAYHRIAALGGRRGRQADVPAEENAFWQNRSFHNYADYASTGAFRQGLDELLAMAQHEHLAVMCSEAVWWRCHRRIIADHLLAHGATVRHIMPGGKIRSAELTPGAVIRDGTVEYP
ncbi:DUF488 family protein [Agromyces laixinhei]|uniref:DUF488 domain-containing protein n=1 Tax=Agromyces laixinhei TaxID=2585717 RepID=UPI001E4027D4|nr:DUF488 domain-containing protein [Agromyces laixinhei]